MNFISILAYVDPGSGALIWQTILCAIVGCLFYLKKSRDFLWRAVTSLLRPRSKSTPNTSDIQPGNKS
jgi:hypothetical protein